MKIIFEITNHEEALAAQNMLSAYLGTEAPKAVVNTKVGIEHTEVEKPKAKRQTRTTKAKVEELPEVTEPEVEKPVEKKETVEKSGDIDLKELTAIAKAAVAKTDRATVKDAISAYGAKLSEVEAADYEILAKELKAL